MKAMLLAGIGGGVLMVGVAFAGETPVLDVVVSEDGTVNCLTVTGSLPQEGGIVRLSGSVSCLVGGTHRLLACPAVGAGANWTLELPEGFVDDRISLLAADGILKLKVAKGLIVVFR